MSATIPDKKKEIKLCDPYIWEDPRYLFRTAWFGTTSPSCASELINQIIFIYLFFILTGLLAYAYIGIAAAPILSGLAATVFLLPTFLKLRDVEAFRTEITGDESKEDGLPKQTSAEGFKGAPADTNQTGTRGNPLTLSFQDQTTPGVRNPFHNVTLDELPDGHTPFTQRPAAADITDPERKIALDDFFRVNWYNDPTDVFGKTQSQRMFVSQPSTTIPNDQGSYQDWLYKIPGKTCKEGNPAACYAGTEGAALPWLNM